MNDFAIRRAATKRQASRESRLGLTLDRGTLDALCAETDAAASARRFLRKTDYPRFKQVERELARRRREAAAG